MFCRLWSSAHCQVLWRMSTSSTWPPRRIWFVVHYAFMTVHIVGFGNNNYNDIVGKFVGRDNTKRCYWQQLCTSRILWWSPWNWWSAIYILHCQLQKSLLSSFHGTMKDSPLPLTLPKLYATSMKIWMSFTVTSRQELSLNTYVNRPTLFMSKNEKSSGFWAEAFNNVNVVAINECMPKRLNAELAAPSFSSFNAYFCRFFDAQLYALC